MPGIVVTGPASGPENMQIDLALLAAAEAGQGPFLRLYRWDGPWVSLGRADRDAAPRASTRTVARPTGGKALLHDRDLTYSVTLPATHRLAQMGIVESYKAISAYLVTALNAIGVDATLGTFPEQIETRAHRKDVPCATEVHVDTVLVGGRKLIGSAQVRRKKAVLQHGSIPLAASSREVIAGLLPEGQFPDDAWMDWYHSRTTTLEREGALDARAPLEAALIAAFSDL